MTKDTKLESTNIILVIIPKEHDTWKRFVKISKPHAEELRDLIQLYLDTEYEK